MKLPAVALPLALLAACATTPATDAKRDFHAHLESLCGQAYEGQVVSPAVEADRDFAGRRLIMHVRDCSDEEIRIPFNVGGDRSRTWVISRHGAIVNPYTASFHLRLKHDHRHEDGSEDRLSGYGGDTLSPGSATRQEFPADTFSRALFQGENIPQSVNNVWALEIHPGRIFAYELRRPGRFFRVEFDLTRPVPPPSPTGGMP
jgi:hypothetical protein